MSTRLVIASLLGVLLQIQPILGQTDSTKVPVTEHNGNALVVPPAQRVDTIRYLPPSDLLHLPPIDDSSSSESRLTQNPTTALFRSMFVPGWGQIVNKSYLKAGLYGGLQLYFLSRSIHFAREASQTRKTWNNATDVSERNAFYDQYLKSADGRNANRWYFGITTIISMFDAYVDAQLSGRPKSTKNASHMTKKDGMSIDLGAPGNGTVQLSLKF